MIMIVSLIHD